MDKAWRYVGDPTVDQPGAATIGNRVFRIGDVTGDDMTEDYRFVVIVNPTYEAPASPPAAPAVPPAEPVAPAPEPAAPPAEEAPAPVIAPTS